MALVTDWTRAHVKCQLEGSNWSTLGWIVWTIMRANTHTHAHSCELHTCVDTHASADRVSFSTRNFADTLNFTLICIVRRLFIDYNRSLSGVDSCNSLYMYILIRILLADILAVFLMGLSSNSILK